MAALRPPTELRAVHSRIVSVIEMAPTPSIRRSLHWRTKSFDGECYFEFNTQWQQFQDESDRITAQYGQAYDTWQAAVARAEKQAKKADLPSQPVL